MKTDGQNVVRGACPLDCPDACSWEVTVEGEKAILLRGTQSHPYTQGNLCVKVNNYLEHTQSKDRLLYPLRRIGRKGSGAFERISWEEALSEIAERLLKIKREHGGEAIWPYFGTGSMGYIQGIWGAGYRLWNVLGASQHQPTICSIAGIVGTSYTLGTSTGMDPENVQFAKLIILWGSNPLSCGNHLWRFISKARRNGAHLVVIDPVRTRSAAKADEHIQILPGTDAALALGLLHVVVSLGCEDKVFLQEQTTGWQEFKKRILEYPVERVAEITKLPSELIWTLGERLAKTRPTAIRMSMGMQRHAGGGMAVRTITAIPGVTGDWRNSGGGVVYSTGGLFQGNVSKLRRDDLRSPNIRSLLMTRLGEGLLEKQDPPVKALFIYGANPVVSTSHQNKVRKGLQRPDLFTVVVENFNTDTVDYADIVLPSAMQTERADLHNGYGHLYLLWNEPAVSPPGECLSHTEIFRRLAKAMGLNERSLYDTDEELAEALLDSDHPALNGITLETLKREGWQRLSLPKPYLPFEDGFPTASGKLEFHSHAAMEAGFDPLPDYTPPIEISDEELAKRYPLVLVTPASHFFLNSTLANKPDLQAKAGPVKIYLHHDDAKARGLSNGVQAKIFNNRGAFEATVEVSNMVRNGVVASTKGHWPKLVGQTSTANATVDERDADMGGGAVYHDNRVEVKGLHQ